MKKLLTAFKGKVTVAGVVTFVVGVITQKQAIIDTYQGAVNQDSSTLVITSVIGSAVAIFGKVRRLTEAYKNA